MADAEGFHQSTFVAQWQNEHRTLMAVVWGSCNFVFRSPFAAFLPRWKRCCTPHRQAVPIDTCVTPPQCALLPPSGNVWVSAGCTLTVAAGAVVELSPGTTPLLTPDVQCAKEGGG